MPSDNCLRHRGREVGERWPGCATSFCMLVLETDGTKTCELCLAVFCFAMIPRASSKAQFLDELPLLGAQVTASSLPPSARHRTHFPNRSIPSFPNAALLATPHRPGVSELDVGLLCKGWTHASKDFTMRNSKRNASRVKSMHFTGPSTHTLFLKVAAILFCMVCASVFVSTVGCIHPCVYL